MSISNHRKYYDYIIGKIRFQRDLELKRKQDAEFPIKQIKLPRLIPEQDIENDDEMIKSLGVYFKSEPFLEENMAIIRNRNNPSFDKSAA